jgi:predicted N-acetyltransferase YhbS
MTAAASAPFIYRAERPEDGPAIDALMDRALGPGRHALTAYRLREDNAHLFELALVGEREDRLVGTVRFWPVAIGQAAALLLGPLAIDPPVRNMGCGLGLMLRGLAGARAAGHRLVILVGDPPYYARAGFAPVPAGRIMLPGPVDARRILHIELAPGALADVRGTACRPPRS